MTPPPLPDSCAAGADATFRQALDAGRFLIQRCEQCERAVFYPRMICPHCGAERLGWIEPEGAGVVYATTVVRRKPQAGGDYNVALVDLTEGVRMMSRIDGMPPEAVAIGMAVRARVIQENGQGLVVFTAQEEIR